jgi:hypothetical protein
MRTHLRRTYPLILALLALTAGAAAQLAMSALKPKINQPASGQGASESGPQIALPAGAGANITPGGTAAAGPFIGFEVFKPDSFMISTFFTFAPPQAITSSQQRDFGSFILNPTGQGTSYTFASNWTGTPQCKSGCFGSKLDIGVALRGGITLTSWSGSSSAPATQGGVAYLTPEFLVMSRTLRAGGDAANDYQVGFSVGPTFRWLNGDLSQGSNATLRQTLLGTSRTSMTGWEFTLMARLNEFQPYVTVSHFPRQSGSDISGFTGEQAVFGVNVVSAIFLNKLSN